ncbi:hypothetical protein E2I00_006828, partial [Balaenoptera physalus]
PLKFQGEWFVLGLAGSTHKPADSPLLGDFVDPPPPPEQRRTRHRCPRLGREGEMGFPPLGLCGQGAHVRPPVGVRTLREQRPQSEHVDTALPAARSSEPLLSTPFETPMELPAGDE